MEFELIRSQRKTLSLEISHGKLLVRAPVFVTDEQIERFLYDHRRWIQTHLERERQRESGSRRLSREELDALMAQAREVIPQRVAHYAPLVGVSYDRVTIRCQRTRWGSCSAKGNLNFNCLLLLAPREVLDSVVVHELCHRKVMNHSQAFYRQVLRVYPDYWKHHSWLREHGTALLELAENATGGTEYAAGSLFDPNASPAG